MPRELLQSCKERKGTPYVTRVCPAMLALVFDAMWYASKVVSVYFYSSVRFMLQRSYLVALKTSLQIIIKKGLI